MRLKTWIPISSVKVLLFVWHRETQQTHIPTLVRTSLLVDTWRGIHLIGKLIFNEVMARMNHIRNKLAVGMIWSTPGCSAPWLSGWFVDWLPVLLTLDKTWWRFPFPTPPVAMCWQLINPCSHNWLTCLHIKQLKRQDLCRLKQWDSCLVTVTCGCVYVKTCMCRSGLILCFLRRITCAAGCWYIHGPPSVLSCYTLCRYSRPVLTTSDQKSGVLLHCTLSFPQKFSKKLKEILYVEDPDTVCIGSTSQICLERSCIFLSFSPWLLSLEKNPTLLIFYWLFFALFC